MERGSKNLHCQQVPRDVATVGSGVSFLRITGAAQRQVLESQGKGYALNSVKKKKKTKNNHGKFPVTVVTFNKPLLRGGLGSNVHTRN